MTHRTESSREINQIALKADQSTSRNHRLDQHRAGLMVHTDYFRLPASERLQNISKVFIWNVDIESLVRLRYVAQIVLVKDHFGPRYQEFESLASHLFD